MRALVYGKGISGKGSFRLLSRNGYDVEYIDDGSRTDVLDDADIVVLSPSVSTDKPIIEEARRRGIEVIGEIELAYRYNKADIIAVTGTNGKTTTSMMIDRLLKESGISSHLLGNIGKSFASSVDRIKSDDMVVLEVSSFQLETIVDFRPKVAVLLNITPDHLERHGNFESYVATKFRIFENMQRSDYAILNYDDETVRTNSAGIMPNTYFFSTKERVRGTYIKDKAVYFLEEKLFDLKDIKIKSEHNISNALAMITIAKLFNIPASIILRTLNSFSLPPHRIQFIGRYRNKNYFNDSKATNIDATIKAVNSMKGSTCLIIGGYDKGISYKPLFDSLTRNIRSIVVFGQNRHIIENEIKNYDIRYYICDSLTLAIMCAAKERVDNVLFSPGTSSYDMFKNYEERGDMFVKLTGDINEG